MKRVFVILILGLLVSSCSKKTDIVPTIVSTDIDHFWEAYDQMQKTTDSTRQIEILKELYLDKASEGLKDIIQTRRYTETEYVNAMTSYPEFWSSIKENTLRIETYKNEIHKDINALKKAYPDLQPSTLYFTMGAFRTNGTILGNNILIGSELALADKTTVTHELPKWRQPYYQEYKPLENLSLLCTHEYVHTQQNELVEDLLSMCLYEGIAEFISCHVTQKSSSTPAIQYGKNNTDKVVKQFVEDMYLMSNNYNWLWGENRNQFKIRDLGYFIGYEIAESYYHKAPNKTKAIKELIELDYTNQREVERIVDASQLLPQPVAKLYQEYENKRPTVTTIKEFKNFDTLVDPNITSITVSFSQALNGIHTGLDYGPLGDTFYPKVDNASRRWTQDNKSYTFNVTLEPNKKYQMMIGSNFRLSNGVRLKPYTIEFQTTH